MRCLQTSNQDPLLLKEKVIPTVQFYSLVLVDASTPSSPYIKELIYLIRGLGFK